MHNLSFREPQPNDPGLKKIVAHDFGKQEDRFKVDLRREMDLLPDEVVIDNKLPDKKIKGNVDIGRDK